MIIALEGIDASGKRTQTNLLCTALQHLEFRVATISFPRYGETVFSKSITSYLQGKFGGLETVDPHHAALLYAGDRFESKTVLQRRSKNRDFLIMDRYVASNIAYQAARISPPDRDSFIEWITQIEYEVYKLPKAALTIYLDMPARISAKLIAARRSDEIQHTGQDIHEQNMSYLEACRDVYRELAETNHYGPWVTVPCTDHLGDLRSIETIHRDVLTIVRNFLADCVAKESYAVHSNGRALDPEKVASS